MDMFMDKLAQKLTAQEIIRANTAADTEELNRLRNQIAEYNDCLTKLQKLIDEGTEKFQAFQTGGLELDDLMEDNIGKVSAALRQDVSELTERLEELDTKLGASNEPVLNALTGLEKSLQEKLQQFDSKLGEQQEDGQLTEKLNAVDENVHKECVKVYRNVQAVILAESEKQREAVSNSVSGVTGIGKKVRAVLTVSVLALIISSLSVALQVLGMLNLLPF